MQPQLLFHNAHFDDSPRLAPSAVVLCSSAVVVLTANFLGARWLSIPVLGLPFGLWIIATVFALWRRGWLGLLDTAMPFGAPRPRFDLSPVTERKLAPVLRKWVALKAGTRHIVHSIWSMNGLSWRDIGDCVARALDVRPELADPICIGIHGTRAQAEAIRDQQPVVPVRWQLLDRADGYQPGLFDLLFCVDPEQGGTATLPENEHRPATWFDWAKPRPLSFASVFPHQNDPAQLSVGVLPTVEDPNPLVGAMLVAAAVQGRTSHRLSIMDRLRGRIPPDGEETAGTIDPGAFRAKAMRRLHKLLSQNAPSQATTLERTAASVLNAWLVTTSARIDMHERRMMMEHSCLFLPDRPEAWLRLAAVRIADLDDEGGIEAIMRADPFVRAHREQLLFDQAEFVQSEMEHGGSSSMTLGRVAAGFCLLTAQYDYERLDFIRDDLIEEIDHAGWLVGRDQDTQLLRRIIDELHRTRRAEARGLPQPQLVSATAAPRRSISKQKSKPKRATKLAA